MYMWQLNAQGKLPFLLDRVRRWSGCKDTKIDIVALGTNGPQQDPVRRVQVSPECPDTGI